ncbi:hypothetical protein AHiyo6_04990, partial [Arthrobacter sp. Hiyo6]
MPGAVFALHQMVNMPGKVAPEFGFRGRIRARDSPHQLVRGA